MALTQSRVSALPVMVQVKASMRVLRVALAKERGNARPRDYRKDKPPNAPIRMVPPGGDGVPVLRTARPCRLDQYPMGG